MFKKQKPFVNFFHLITSRKYLYKININIMTTPVPTTPPVQPKKTKKSKTTGPVVLLPKGKFPTSVGDYELLDEATREKKEEVAQKTAEEEVNEKEFFFFFLL